LKNEDPEVFDVFLDFLVRIERNLHYLEKQEYINLAKDFLDDQITADDFSYSFMAIYGGIGQKLGQMKKAESVELANF
jgi:Tfp pilus assembly protein PilF